MIDYHMYFELSIGGMKKPHHFLENGGLLARQLKIAPHYELCQSFKQFYSILLTQCTRSGVLRKSGFIRKLRLKFELYEFSHTIRQFKLYHLPSVLIHLRNFILTLHYTIFLISLSIHIRIMIMLNNRNIYNTSINLLIAYNLIIYFDILLPIACYPVNIQLCKWY